MRKVNLSEIVNGKYVCNSAIEDVITILIRLHKEIRSDGQIINIDISCDNQRAQICTREINEIVRDFHNHVNMTGILDRCL